jgi:type II secretory ATPase GspE/PulE/Tfp pilus assembly ATPase PilB-like protein
MEEQFNVSKVKMQDNIGEYLVEEKFITREQLNLALAIQQKQGGQLNEVLLNQNMIKAEDLASMLSVQLNIPYIDLQRHKVQTRALKLIPETFARKHTLIPLDVVGESIVVVMEDPQDLQTIRDIQTQAKMQVKVALGVASDIRKAIDLNYRSSAEIEKRIKEFAPNSAVEETRVTEELVARTPIAQTVDLIIAQAVRDRASDIHVEPQEDRLRIRFRIDGTLHDMFSLPIAAHIPLVSRIKILAEMNIAEQRRPQDGQISFTVAEKQIDIRVASLPITGGERLSLRILDKSLSLFTLAQLGLLQDIRNKFETMIKSPYGLVLVGGPTGSGKTTTLYALINGLNRQERNIMTIEDPVEYRFKDINQTQVNIKAGITFPTGLRALMRHDPNVILVGEIRDQETAAIAVQAALTGHLVLSSIHANNSVGVLFRLMDLGIEPYLIISTLVGISTQRMVKRICPHCQTTRKPTEQEIKVLTEETGRVPEVLFEKGTGCNLCANTGYQGRTGLFEVMLMSDTIRKMLLTNVNAVDILAQAIKEGLVTMKKDGLRKVNQGIIPIEEVVRSVFSVG